MGKEGQAPPDSLKSEIPSQGVYPLPETPPFPPHKYWPQTFWALRCLSLHSVHTPLLAVVENKFHSKVSNHFTRVRDLGGPRSLFYLIIFFKRTYDLLSQKTHGCRKEQGRLTALAAAPSPKPLAQPQADLLHQPERCDFEAYPHILQRIYSTGKPKLDS